MCVSQMQLVFLFLLGIRRRRGVGQSRNDHHGHCQDHQRLRIATILLKLKLAKLS
jgi:hypothetical protein